MRRLTQCCPQVDASLRAGEDAQRKLTMLETALSLPGPDWERAAAEAKAARSEQQERCVPPGSTAANAANLLRSILIAVGTEP